MTTQAMIGIFKKKKKPEVSGQVEGDRKPLLSASDVLLIESITFLHGAETGILNTFTY